ncbi:MULTISPECIES: phosphate-starvation-inducible PsiE family protein [Chromohalobacter]|uniref:Diguanylate cyclase n=3 Tax=Chromohalobacter TaxID=42054 RepID=A0A1Q8TF20_9GAMM|nr:MULTISPECIES: phosphate-starvation-inducible PsiE family protein [Chromohalobacter]CDQ34425.1 phosphate-starvation-inducible protein PsiE [Virgibacillus halodenitrificans]MCK0753211.1 phosphate-starvation-inducible PsiE family protein [Chromohalobacter japonicus]MCK0765841.1 phosphate-starvation-inducible PsiE family protein [Chromohalobacter beijerinckii]MCK2043405.1 phosphate-starvation-inducible PsiE family protein [Chromohalobacter moromii]MCT8505643.1 phosphate-starvation-inducible Psi
MKKWFPELMDQWSQLSGYQRFERLVSLVLTVAIGFVVLVALYYLVVHVIELLFVQTRDPFDYRVFQAVFDMILTVLIAMEFNNSIVRTMEGRGGFIQVEIVVLIAIMALVRKFMVMDMETIEPLKIVALAAAVLALGLSYWLVRRGGNGSS